MTGPRERRTRRHVCNTDNPIPSTQPAPGPAHRIPALTKPPPTTHPSTEQHACFGASGTGFSTYGFAWGINHGLLDREKYQKVALRGWARRVETVSPEGEVLWGQPVSASPCDIRREDSHEYVTGAFLLSASEMWNMVTTADQAGGGNQQ